MKIVLSAFHYHFTLEGASGGLFLIRCKFQPKPEQGDGVDELKAATKRLMQTYADVLERLYGDVIEGGKEPILTDNTYDVSTGYQYAGKLKEGKKAALEQRLQTLFGAEPKWPFGDVSPYLTLKADIECSFKKSDNRQLDDLSVEVSIRMSHDINVCFFEFIKTLDWIEVEENAQKDMDKLRHSLETTTKAKGIDYFEQIIEQ